MNMDKETFANQIDKAWEAYYNYDSCKGCYDCIDCSLNSYKINLMKKAKNLEEGFKNVYGITYTEYKKHMNDYLNKDMGYHDNTIDNTINIINASDAHGLSRTSLSIIDNRQLKDVMNNIQHATQYGEYHIYYEDLRKNVKNKLEDLGYNITESYNTVEGNISTIEW